MCGKVEGCSLRERSGERGCSLKDRTWAGSEQVEGSCVMGGLHELHASSSLLSVPQTEAVLAKMCVPSQQWSVAFAAVVSWCLICN